MSKVQIAHGVWWSPDAPGSICMADVLSGVSFCINPCLPTGNCMSNLNISLLCKMKHRRGQMIPSSFPNLLMFNYLWWWKGKINMSSTDLLLILQHFCDEWFLNTSELTNEHYSPIWKEQLFKWHPNVYSWFLNVKYSKTSYNEGGKTNQLHLQTVFNEMQTYTSLQTESW